MCIEPRDRQADSVHPSYTARMYVAHLLYKQRRFSLIIGVCHVEGFSSQVEEATDDPNQQPAMEMLSQSPVMGPLLKKMAKVATTNVSVLVLGETGVGKGLLAKKIHIMSPRHRKAFIPVNCAGLSPGLVESSLLGHEKGASTSAGARHRGYFERAHGGTLFLDEIGDMSMAGQQVLLHVLEADRLTRVGGTTSIPISVRIIAATNRNLTRAIAEGTFRDDLFQRLSVFPLMVPPLRERWEDIPMLADHFVHRAQRPQRPQPPLSDAAMAYLKAYDWPGNVRELEHWIERMMVLYEGEQLELADVLDAEAMGRLLVPSAAAPAVADRELPLAGGEDEPQRIITALRKTNWIVSGERGAAHLLGMSDRTLQYRMRKYGIQRPKKT